MKNKIIKFLVVIFVFSISFYLISENIKKLSVNKNKCVGCTLCVDKCPVKAIEMKNEKAYIDLAKCVGCGICKDTCPVKAIFEIKNKQNVGENKKEILKDSLKVTKSKEDSLLIKKNLQNNFAKKVINYNISIMKCISCKMCIPYCPVKAIKYDKNYKSAIIDVEKCINCGKCYNICPTKAIQKIK